MTRLGVCYYPEHWDRSVWRDDAKRMADLGLSLVRLGEFAWSLIEPGPGQMAWDWLDESIGILADENLEIMLGTPTATPPKWLIDKHDDILAWDRDGRVRGFGSRRHYCFSSETYQSHSQRNTDAMANRYGAHPAVTMWQTDNEFGCHDTVRSYSPMAAKAFRAWLETKYTDVHALNIAWGNIFWSQTYQAFDQIELPNLTTTEANPTHWLDFYRCSSDHVVRFHRQQADIIRQHAPLSKITHNAMGHCFDFDHFEFGRHVDVLTWDSYPLGFLSQSRSSDAHKHAYLRQGDPDFAGFHHDLYRSCAPAFAVIEQQPGPVNWAPDNPAPLPGMVGTWLMETLAHGGEFASVFRWRQAPFAQEQNHAGMLRPDDQPAAAFCEVAELKSILPQLTDAKAPASVALLFDYESLWMSEIQPQGTGWNYQDIAESWYRAVRRLGLDIDIVAPGAPLTDYQLVLVPSLFHVSDEASAAFEATDAQLLFGPRSGSKDVNGNIPPDLGPDKLRPLIPLTVARSESVPAFETPKVTGPTGTGAWHAWRDDVVTELAPILSDEHGRAVLFHHERTQMFAALPDDNLINSVVETLAEKLSLKSGSLPDGLRLRRGCGHRFAFNYSTKEQTIPTGLAPADGLYKAGNATLAPGSFAMWVDQ